MADPDYGLDLSALDDFSPLLATVTGTDLMREVAFRRLYCRAGNLLSNPLDNTLDVRDFLNGSIRRRPDGTPDLSGIAGKCVIALLGDVRISEAVVTPSFDFSTGVLTLAISCVGSEGPFELTIAVTSLTVELLVGH